MWYDYVMYEITIDGTTYRYTLTSRIAQGVKYITAEATGFASFRGYYDSYKKTLTIQRRATYREWYVEQTHREFEYETIEMALNEYSDDILRDLVVDRLRKEIAR